MVELAGTSAGIPASLPIVAAMFGGALLRALLARWTRVDARRWRILRVELAVVGSAAALVTLIAILLHGDPRVFVIAGVAAFAGTSGLLGLIAAVQSAAPGAWRWGLGHAAGNLACGVAGLSVGMLASSGLG